MKKEHPKNGLHTEYFENGQKCREGYYKDDKQVGKWTMWYESGQKESEANYKNGQKDGKWTEWDENGQITVSNWKDGECISGDC